MKKLILVVFFLLMGANEHKNQYCELINKISPGTEVFEVFKILGVPTNFSIPATLDLEQIRGKNFHITPTNNLDDLKNQNIEQLRAHPIFSAFLNLPEGQYNNLSWLFDKDNVQINIRLRGSKVDTINNNQGC